MNMFEEDYIPLYINVPTSKSLSNRWLVLNYLSNNAITLSNLSTADDTVLLQTLLKQIEAGNNNVFYCKNAGTTARFLTALLSIQEGKEYIIDGDERMRQRPISPMVEALQQIGCDILYINKQGYFPLKIKGRQPSSNRISISGALSSQFISALMLVAPFLQNGLSIEIKGKIVSESYITMTKKVLEQAGVSVLWENNNIHIHNTIIKQQNISIEKDWSSVSYIYNWVLFSEKNYWVHIKGIVEDSWQGDKVVATLYEPLGVATSYTENGIILTRKACTIDNFMYNFSSCPDLVPTLAVACAGLGISGILTGLDTLPYKETNRIEALTNELRKIGVNVLCNENSIMVKGQITTPKTICTYNDHRMAMAFASLQILNKNITIENPTVVGKSFPEYWHEIEVFLAN